MATPQQIIPKMEGMIGYMLGSADGGSVQGANVVTTWVKMVKMLLGEPDFRYLTDLEFVLLNDLDEGATAAGVDEVNEATHFIAALIEVTSTIATDGEGRVYFADSDAFTADSSNPTATQDADILMVSIADVATTGVSEFYPLIAYAGQATDAASGTTYSSSGLNLSVGLAAGVIGTSGGVPATDAVRAWVLVRGTI